MKALLIASVIALGVGLVFQSARLRKSAAQNETLRAELGALRAQAEIAENRNIQPPPASGLSDEERTELLRLRNQAAQLKQATNELQALRARAQQLQTAQSQNSQAAPAPPTPAPSTASPPVPRESWAFVGYATPEATLQSAIFSMSQGDLQTFMASMSPEEAQRVQRSFEGKSPEQVAQEGQRESAKIKSFQILAREELAPDRVVLQVYADGEDRVQRVLMQKIGEEWKWAGKGGRATQQQQPPQ